MAFAPNIILSYWEPLLSISGLNDEISRFLWEVAPASKEMYELARRSPQLSLSSPSVELYVRWGITYVHTKLPPVRVLRGLIELGMYHGLTSVLRSGQRAIDEYIANVVALLEEFTAEPLYFAGMYLRIIVREEPPRDADTAFLEALNPASLDAGVVYYQNEKHTPTIALIWRAVQKNYPSGFVLALLRAAAEEAIEHVDFNAFAILTPDEEMRLKGHLETLGRS